MLREGDGLIALAFGEKLLGRRHSRFSLSFWQEVYKKTSGFFDENRRRMRLTILVDLRTKQGENRVVSSVGSESVGTIAYLRISTGGQDFNTQRFTILDYAQQHGLVIDTFVESQSSS